MPRLLAFLLMMALAAGCGDSRRPDGDDDDRARRTTGDTQSNRPWRETGGSYTIAAADPEFERAFDEAVARARETLDDARRAWMETDPADRDHWLIKWAAPVESDSGPSDESAQAVTTVEYVWVRPVRWSPFRIEGVLATASQHDIGFEHGDLVAFPIEQVVDWVHKLEGAMDGPRRGGFTVEALENFYGPPGDQPDS